VSVRPGCLTEDECGQLGWNLTGPACHDHRITHAVPDVFLLSLILALGTFGLAVFLRNARSGRWFPAIVSDNCDQISQTDPRDALRRVHRAVLGVINWRR